MGLAGMQPGIQTAVETAERQPWWGRHEQQLRKGVTISSAAVDAGNTPTTILRAGLILAQLNSGGKWVAWDPNSGADTGAETARGVLEFDLDMLNPSGTAVDRDVPILVGGLLKATSLLIEGTAMVAFTASSQGNGPLARLQLGNSFLFDDQIPFRGLGLGSAMRNRQVVAADTALTVVAADTGSRFVISSTTDNFPVTLPTIAPGLVFEFLRATDSGLVVASAAGDDMIVGNDASADSVTFTTAGQQIGAMIRVESIYVGTALKWLVTLPNVPFGTGLTGGFAYAIAT